MEWIVDGDLCLTSWERDGIHLRFLMRVYFFNLWLCDFFQLKVTESFVGRTNFVRLLLAGNRSCQMNMK